MFENDQVALVTGAGSGIGRATAVLFAQQKCRVVAADRDLAGAQETAALIADAGGECLAVQCDITDPDQVAAAVAATRQRWGRLDYAFNNAGVNSKVAPIHELSLEEFDRVMGVNVRGHFIALKSQIPLMLETSPSPAIVLTSSVCGHAAYPGLSAYAASKHAVIGLVRAAAAEYGPLGLRINSVSPGPVLTPMLVDMDVSGSGRLVTQMLDRGASLPKLHPAAAAAAAASSAAAEAPASAAEAEQPRAAPTTEVKMAAPLKRVGEPSEVAQVVVFLCSEAARFVTGADLAVDGGMLCRLP